MPHDFSIAANKFHTARIYQVFKKFHCTFKTTSLFSACYMCKCNLDIKICFSEHDSKKTTPINNFVNKDLIFQNTTK